MANWKNRIVGHGEENPKNLIPNPKNIKDHDVYQRKVINGILSQVGVVQSIIVNKTTGNIVDGHMRVEEAIKNGEQLIPVTYIEISPEDEDALLLLFDPVGSLAKQKSEKVKELIATVEIANASARDFVKSIAKKNDAKVEKYNETGDDSSEKFVIDDDDLSVEDGDIFEISGDGILHRLLCGSCEDKDNFYRLFNGEKPILCVTSPPYNQKINTFKPSGMQKENTKFVDRMADSYSDDLPEEEYQKKQISMINSICEFLKENGSLFYNHKVRYRDKKIVTPLEWLMKIDYPIRQEIIWDRGGSIAMNARMFMPSDERIYWIRKSDDFIFNDETEIKSWSSVWKFAAKNDVKISAAFPFELPYRCILSCSAKGDNIFDPYSGSGTTIMAAHKLGRSGYGIEISPSHVKNSLLRFKSEGLEINKV